MRYIHTTGLKYFLVLTVRWYVVQLDVLVPEGAVGQNPACLFLPPALLVHLARVEGPDSVRRWRRVRRNAA